MPPFDLLILCLIAINNNTDNNIIFIINSTIPVISNVSLYSFKSYSTVAKSYVFVFTRPSMILIIAKNIIEDINNASFNIENYFDTVIYPANYTF